MHKIYLESSSIIMDMINDGKENTIENRDTFLNFNGFQDD